MISTETKNMNGYILSDSHIQRLLTKNRYSAAIISLFNESFDGLIGSFAAPKCGHLIEFNIALKSLQMKEKSISNHPSIAAIFSNALALTLKTSP